MDLGNLGKFFVGTRKFILTGLIFVVISILKFMSLLDDSAFATIVIAIIGVFSAANVVEHRKK